jgi:DNA polymerase-3 subunit alpha
VGVSGFSFGVDGVAIRFGLGAVKNLGQKAIETLVAARDTDGPFRSLLDFCRRLDLQLVNRRVVESLVKAGALDSLGRSRAGLLAGLDAAFDAGQRHQRERAEGQASIFDLMGGPGGPAGGSVDDLAEPVVPDWDSDQQLASEKEVLGFYLSGHPLRRVWDQAVRLGAVSTGALEATPDGTRIVMCGLVSALREINTKNGNRMGFITLEDVEGTVEVTIFPETFRQAALHLRGAGPVLVRGKVEGGG